MEDVTLVSGNNDNDNERDYDYARVTATSKQKPRREHRGLVFVYCKL